jgi:AraC-like DNA-binding protein
MATAGTACGVDVQAALLAVGIEPACLDDADARIPVQREQALWEELARCANDPCFGLQAQTHIEPGAIDVFDYAVRSSPDIRHAIQNMVRYTRLAHDLVDIELRVEGDEARIVHRHRLHPVDLSAQATDYSVGGIVIVMRELCGSDFTPVEIRIARERPQDVGPYESLLGTTPQFGGLTNEIAFTADILERPVSTADAGLHHLLARRAEELLASLPRMDDVATRVRVCIAESLCGGDPSIEMIAERLGMGARTLQRRLAEAGTTHQELLNLMRREMARDLLRDDNIGINEIAYLLGYSERSAFHRAFKRWYGVAPAAFRGQPELTHGDA